MPVWSLRLNPLQNLSSPTNLLQSDIGFQRRSWRTNTYNTSRIEQLRDQPDRELGILLLEEIVVHLLANILDPLFGIDEAGTKTAAITKKIAVQVTMVSIVNALQTSVSLAGERIAADGTTWTNRRCALQVPLARIACAERFVGEHSGRADFH